jgi:hypothetical protein
MTTQEIIDQIFHPYTDDTTELSDSEELALANRVYKKICRSRPWEFLKTEATGTTSTSVPYVSLPSDFAFFAENGNLTDTSQYNDGNASPKFVFVGTAQRKYQIINYSDRRQYADKDGYAYLDLANSRLVFTLQPATAESYSFDYIKVPDELTANTSPVFPSDFHPIIGYGMAIDGFAIQLFEPARSYAQFNMDKYNSCLQDMAYWNANLLTN